MIRKIKVILMVLGIIGLFFGPWLATEILYKVMGI